MKQYIMELLRHADEITEERIAAEFPPAWDMEALYQKSYQKYLQKAEGTPIRVSRRRRIPYQIIGTAACLLLIVGLGVRVWSNQQKIEMQPPEPSTMPVTADTSTESHETEPSAQTTQAESSAAASTEPSAVQDTTESVPAVIPTETAMQEETDSGAETAPPPAQSEAPAETAAVVITPTQADTPETTATPTEVTAEEVPELADEQLDGFRVECYKDHRRVICTDAFPAPDGELQSYNVESSRLELLATSDEAAAEPIRSYEIRDPKTNKVFTVKQREYADFALNIEEGDLIDIGLNRQHGFFLLQEDTCSLYWFCNGEGFYVSGSTEDLAFLMEIVRSFTPAEN